MLTTLGGHSTMKVPLACKSTWDRNAYQTVGYARFRSHALRFTQRATPSYPMGLFTPTSIG